MHIYPDSCSEPEKERELAMSLQEAREKKQEIHASDEVIHRQERDVHTRDEVIRRKEQEIHFREQVIRDKEQEIRISDGIILGRDREIQFKNKTIRIKEQEVATLKETITVLKRAKREASAQIEQLRCELTGIRQKLAAIEGSTTWKVASRLRSALEGYPKTRRLVRRLSRLMWWTVTLQLIDRIRDRRRLFEMRNVIAASDLFDANWYLSSYPDVAEAAWDPALHYALFGAKEHRDPGPQFDARWYLEENPDVAQEKMNPLLHYIRYGAAEARPVHAVDVSQPEPEPQSGKQSEPNCDYSIWVEQYDTITAADELAIRNHITTLRTLPLLSVVMPVYNAKPPFLRNAIESVISQFYPHWELCIADDASSDPEIKRILQDYARRDRRIKVLFRPQNGHISAASNSALEQVGGEFVALMDHDDELAPHALYMVAVELNKYPDADIVYSDEDRIDGVGRRDHPHFKSDWNQTLFYAYNLINHLGVYRTSLVREVGGFRQGFEGSQDYDLVLRILSRIAPKHIRHIPHVLYHWRLGDTFATEHLDDAVKASRAALADYFGSRGVKVQITNSRISFLNRVMWSLPDRAPRVSLIVPTRDNLPLLNGCVEDLLYKTHYPNLEIIIVDNESEEQKTLDYLRSLHTEPRVRVLREPGVFNHSALNNRAAAQATGDFLGFINNDIAVIDGDWLKEMVCQAMQPGIGAVGAKLYYPDGTIQHAGVILGIGELAGHGHRLFTGSHEGYAYRLQVAQNVSCVTAACMITPAQVFSEVGGFDEVNLKASYNDVDLCLKIRDAGYDIVWTPYAELYHFESASRGYDHEANNVDRASSEAKYLKERWGKILAADPFYSPNLTLADESFGLAFPPRTTKPWHQVGLLGNNTWHSKL
jgi:glycosyltransferase involved in cell wall biosynthesis